MSKNPRLPTNRKERYYTGTVLPALICQDNFRHLGLFLSLCGLHDCAVGEDFQFLTEYGFGESVFTEEDKAFWQGPFSHDTPDLVIRSGDWLLTVEAKMFDRPSAADLNKQILAQKKHVDIWIDRLKVSWHEHVLLLPKPLADAVIPQLPALGSAWPVVTWEAVADLYRGLADSYWVNTLDDALSKYDTLVSVGPQYGKYKDDSITGFEIIDAWPDHGFISMGRVGGLDGGKLAEDIGSGNWRTQRYEVSREDRSSRTNWFTIAAFRERLRPDLT